MYMSSEFTRIIFRQGTEQERQGVLFRNGEPAYTVDYKRLFLGDDLTPGGIPVGMKFLGFCRFDENSDNVENVNPGYTGDILFETSTNLLYVLSGDDFRDKNNYFSINKTPVPDNLTIFNNNGRLSLINNALHFGYFAGFSIGRGLEKNPGNRFVMQMKDPGIGLEFDDNQRIAVKRESISNELLANMDRDTVKGSLGIAGPPSDIRLQDLANSLRPFLARTGSGSIGVPVGTIIDYAGSVPPVDYLVCDGSEHPIGEYPDLYDVLERTWGVGTLSTFVVPNLMGRTTVGSGDNYISATSGLNTVVGSYGGASVVELQRFQIPRHHHEFSINIPLQSTTPLLSSTDTARFWGATDGGPDLGVFNSIIGQPHTNIQPSAVVLKCIKAK